MVPLPLKPVGAIYRPTLATASLTVLPALRMPNAEMISKTPRTISQMPATRANVTIESNGYASTTIPAMILMIPKKILQPLPGVKRGR